MANVKNNASAKETKRRLIEAAGEVFAEHGFERATIKEITERAGASTAAVNYHFSDKQELYDQVVQYVHERGDAAFRFLTEMHAGSPRERLNGFVERLLRASLDPSNPSWFCRIKTREMQNPGSATSRYVTNTIGNVVGGLEGLLQEIIGRPVKQPQLSRLVNSVISQCIFYAHNQVILTLLYPDQPPSSEVVEELAEHITKFTLAALSCWETADG
ncbi:MAG TPA: CerR family C-terminal domain-containing protein [Tepidisphaeraceae bacterium]